MKRAMVICICIVGMLLIGTSLYAANGDLIVNGNVGIGTGTTSTAYKLDVSGDVRSSGSISAGGGLIVNGKVGIGKTSPSAPLEIKAVNGVNAIFSSGTISADLLFANADSGANHYMYFGLGSAVTEDLILFNPVSGSTKGFAVRNNGGGWNRISMYHNDVYGGIQTSGSTALAIQPNAGNVGIGTTSPSAGLHIARAGGYGSLMITNTYAGGGSTHFDYPDGRNYIRGTTIIADNGGNVGIGTITPTIGCKLDIAGGYLMVRDGVVKSGTRANYYIALQNDRNMVLYDNNVAVWSSGTSVSDIRLKKNIVPITDVLPKVTQLNGVRFNWIDESWGSQTEIGVIAQEVEKVFPEIVSTDPKSGYKLVHYEKLSPVLLEAIKELKTENDGLKEKLLGLEEKIAQIEKRLDGK